MALAAASWKAKTGIGVAAIIAAVGLILLLVFVFDPAAFDGPSAVRALQTWERPTVPLSARFRLFEGLPLMPIRVNDQTVECVVDTASNFINIASESCKDCDWTRGMLRDDDDGASEDGAGGAFKIKYGSQHDTVEQRDATVHIDETHIDMPIFVTVRRKQEKSQRTSFNICGFMDGSRGGQSLERLIPVGHRLLLVYGKDGGFVSSMHDDRIAPEYFPIQAPWRRLPKANLPFYAAGIRRITVGAPDGQEIVGTSAGKGKFSGARRVRAAVVDTGSNVTSFPPAVFAALRPHLARNHTIYIHFDGTDTPFRLPWQNYRFGGQPHGPLMLNDDVDVVKSVPGTMVLASYALRFSSVLFHKNHFFCRQSQNLN